MLSKKDLSSDEMDILRKSRTPTTWVFENGEVQTNEETQVHVSRSRSVRHSAITRRNISSSIVWKSFSQNTDVHWKNGKTPRLPKMGKQLIVWWIILYLYDDSMLQAYIRNFDADKPWHASLGKLRFSTHRKRDGRRGSNARHSDWKQPFTENLEDLETHVLARPSERKISDSDGDASKLVAQKKKLRIYIHFTKDRNYDRCLRIKISRSFRQKTRWEIYSTNRKVWWLDEQQITKSSTKEVNLEKISGTLSWYQWIQFYQCKNTSSKKTEQSLRKFQQSSQKPKDI